MLPIKVSAVGLALVFLSNGTASAIQHEPTTVPLQVIVLQIRADNQALVDVLAMDGPASPQLKRVVRALHEAYEQSGYGLVDSDEYLQNLLTLYKAANQYRSYRAVLFSDIVKRMILDWAREALVTRPENDRSVLLVIRDALSQMQLDPVDLQVFREPRKDAPVKADELLDPLSGQLEAIAVEQGYETSTAWVRDALRATPRSLETLLLSPNYGDAAVGILRTEMVRTVLLDGTVEFLLRGGDPAQVSVTDIRYFRTVMPYRDSQAFASPVFGIKALKASHVLSVLEPNSVADEELQPYWMKDVFRQ